MDSPKQWKLRDRRGVLISALVISMIVTGPISISLTLGQETSPRQIPSPQGNSLCGSGIACLGGAQEIPGCGVRGQSCDNLTYHKGPVMHHPRNFLIFWIPDGDMYENNSVSNPSNGRYESLLIRYFQDICLTNSFYLITQQYNDSIGPPGPCSFGGSWVDNQAYPNATLSLLNIQTEVGNAMSANGWIPNNGNNEFFVFTAIGVTSTRQLPYCGIHDNATLAGGQVIYADMTDALSNRCTVGSSPNGDLFADTEISIASHEQFESITDPLSNTNETAPLGFYCGPTHNGSPCAWYYNDLRHEIGDQCLGIYSQSNSTLQINGHLYRVQAEWSNLVNGCSYGEPSILVPPKFSICPGTSSIPVSVFPAGYPWLSLSASAYGIADGHPLDAKIQFKPENATPPFYSALSVTVPAQVVLKENYNLTILAEFQDIVANSTSILLQPSPCSILNSLVTANPPYGTAPLSVQFNVTATGGQPPYSYCWIILGPSSINSWPTHWSPGFGVNDPLTGGSMDLDYSATTQQDPVAALNKPGVYFFSQGTTDAYDGGHECTYKGLLPNYLSYWQNVPKWVPDSLWWITAFPSYSSGFIMVGPGSYNSSAITEWPSYGVAPLTVSFSSSQNPTTAGSMCGTDWQFGDGANATGFHVSHTYQVPGIYQVNYLFSYQFSLGNSVSCLPSFCGGFEPFSLCSGGTVLVGSTTPILSVQGNSNVSSGQAPLSVKFSGEAVGGTFPSSDYWSGTGVGQDQVETFTMAQSYNVSFVVPYRANCSHQETLCPDIPSSPLIFPRFPSPFPLLVTNFGNSLQSYGELGFYQARSSGIISVTYRSPPINWTWLVYAIPVIGVAAVGALVIRYVIVRRP